MYKSEKEKTSTNSALAPKGIIFGVLLGFYGRLLGAQEHNADGQNDRQTTYALGLLSEPFFLIHFLRSLQLSRNFSSLDLLLELTCNCNTLDGAFSK